MDSIDSSVVIFKVMVLFITMLAGIYARKTKIIDKKSTKALSSFLVGVTNPLLMISCFQIEYNTELMKTGGIIFILAVIVHFVLIFSSKFLFFFEKSKEDKSIYRFASIFGNVGYVGFPVLKAMFGDIGLFYGAFYNGVFNLLVWTYGFYLMKSEGEKFNIKKIFNPSFIGTVLGILMFVLKIKLPEIILQPVSLVADMTFPLSMIIIGSIICEINLPEVLKDKKLYYFVFLKLIFVPLVLILICKFTNLAPLYAYILIVLQAMPSATVSAIFAEAYGGNSALAVKCVGFSTLLSILIIPMIIYIANLVI